MNTGDLSSGNDHSARAGGSSRREFLGRTIRGGALLAATSVLGSELTSPENDAKPQTNTLPQNPSSDRGATTADLLGGAFSGDRRVRCFLDAVIRHTGDLEPARPFLTHSIG
jgi:hypothetical protein